MSESEREKSFIHQKFHRKKCTHSPHTLNVIVRFPCFCIGIEKIINEESIKATCVDHDGSGKEREEQTIQYAVEWGRLWVENRENYFIFSHFLSLSTLCRCYILFSYITMLQGHFFGLPFLY